MAATQGVTGPSGDGAAAERQRRLLAALGLALAGPLAYVLAASGLVRLPVWLVATVAALGVLGAGLVLKTLRTG